MRISDWSSDVCSSDLEHIPEVGDYHVYDLGTYSFIITRVAADDIRAYYNACLHRGTKLRASGTEGNTEEFKCTFHGWTWNLVCSHKETLFDWDFTQVDLKTLTLPTVRGERLRGFLLSPLDAHPLPLAHRISGGKGEERADQ